MRQTLQLLSLMAILAAPALAQSGRKGAKPTATPPPADQLQLISSAKPKAPEIIDGERIYGSREVDERVRILKNRYPVTPGKRGVGARGA